MRPKAAILVGMSVVSACLLYGAAAVFMMLAPEYGSVVGRSSGIVLSILVMIGLETRLAGRTQVVGAIAVNIGVWLIFVTLIVTDGLFIHRGIAKDIEPSLSGITAYAAPLLGLGIPVAAFGIGIYTLASRLKTRVHGAQR